MLARSCSALSNKAAVIFVPSVNGPALTSTPRAPAAGSIHRPEHAARHDACKRLIERIGEIIEMGQFVGNLEFLRSSLDI